MLGSYAPVSQKGRVLRAVVKEMEGQQTATKFLLTTPPCLISATLQSVRALYNYLDLSKGVLNMMSKTSARKTVVVKATPQVILNNKELQPITTMCLQ